MAPFDRLRANGLFKSEKNETIFQVSSVYTIMD
jgi:hypothetical protein